MAAICVWKRKQPLPTYKMSLSTFTAGPETDPLRVTDPMNSARRELLQTPGSREASATSCEPTAARRCPSSDAAPRTLLPAPSRTPTWKRTPLCSAGGRRELAWREEMLAAPGFPAAQSTSLRGRRETWRAPRAPGGVKGEETPPLLLMAPSAGSATLSRGPSSASPDGEGRCACQTLGT